MSNMILVTDAGFVLDDWAGQPIVDAPEFLAPNKAIIQLSPEDDIEPLIGHFDQIKGILLSCSTVHDGRALSQARALRHSGFLGGVRVMGALHVEQYRHFRQCGIDGVYLSAEQAVKMPETHWLDQRAKLSRSYQQRLGQARFEPEDQPARPAAASA